MDQTDQIDRLRDLYDLLDTDDEYEQDLGYRNPAAAAYWRLRDELVFEAATKHLESAGMDSRILEVGCGFGNEIAKFSQLGLPASSLYGVDAVERRVDEARRRYPGVNYSVQNVLDLDFPDETFDIVCQFWCAMHAENQESLARMCLEMQRVLKKTGIIIWWDMAPMTWRVLVARRLLTLLSPAAEKGTRWRAIRSTLQESVSASTRRLALVNSVPEWATYTDGSELRDLFGGATPNWRNVGVNFNIWRILWGRSRTLAKAVWYSRLLAQHCFAVIPKSQRT
jgi:ubiquinone/menaquinone biosynthesis C-methylase UbiE